MAIKDLVEERIVTKVKFKKMFLEFVLVFHRYTALTMLGMIQRYKWFDSQHIYIWYLPENLSNNMFQNSDSPLARNSCEYMIQIYVGMK